MGFVEIESARTDAAYRKVRKRIDDELVWDLPDVIPSALNGFHSTETTWRIYQRNRGVDSGIRTIGYMDNS